MYAVEPSLSAECFHTAYRELYSAFATPSCWELVPGCATALQAVDEWRAHVGPAMVLSNFDERLPKLLSSFNLTSHFDSVVYSAQLAHEKPEPQAFRLAEQFLVSPEHSSSPSWLRVHVGDSIDNDVRGALAAGWWAVGLTALPMEPHPAHTRGIASLAQLAGALQDILAAHAAEHLLPQPPSFYPLP